MSPFPHAFARFALLLLPIHASGQFGPEQLVLSGAAVIQRAVEDIDGDGDADVLLLLMGVDIVLLENSDGQGAFAVPVTVRDGDDGCHSLNVADID